MFSFRLGNWSANMIFVQIFEVDLIPSLNELK